MTHGDQFDGILGEALAEYREAEPLAGIEDRILERIRLQPEPRHRWWYWAAAAAALAVLLVAVWMGQRTSHRREGVAVPVAREQALPANPVQKTAQAPEAKTKTMKPQIAKVSRPRRKNPETQLEAGRHMRREFPEPALLNREERALLALANSRPDELSRLTRADGDKEIDIAPIAIAPLAEHDGAQGDH